MQQPDARTTTRSYYTNSTRNLGQDLRALGANHRAIVIYLPNLVALLKPVNSSDSVEQWQQLKHSPADADAWYAHLLVGDMELARCIGHELEPLRYLCFQRGERSERTHRIKWQRFLND